ncbi:acyl-CoA-binding domain-containing protein 4 isoform X2 [Fukomys damarensis]|uniref:acyl-CoA-binding domain-containing protein 4 isoform X2 n=1 Tax=Fukomys damarensis TaxID=885580 RepID=UPI000540281D|nr:acyl-CoA-binding domain-containing protein 4 isoform X2 [Fukomys damarensis]
MGTERGDPEPACREQFQAAVSVIQSLPRTGSYRPSYEEMLRFYSYYKQATLGPCLAPRPGFWDPIGRYKWDAWHSLGRMSKEEAMSAYVAEIKLVAQKVIPNMPRPPEAFLRRITGCKEQVLCRDDGAIPGPPYLSTEPAPPGPESQTPRDLDLDIFCDSLEQLEPELVRPPCLPLPSPEAAPVPLPRLVTQVWAEQRGAAGRDPKTKTSLESPEEKAGTAAPAPQALGSHTALLPPVAFRCAVAPATASDPEEVTSDKASGMSPSLLGPSCPGLQEHSPRVAHCTSRPLPCWPQDLLFPQLAPAPGSHLPHSSWTARPRPLTVLLPGAQPVRSGLGVSWPGEGTASLTTLRNNDCVTK